MDKNQMFQLVFWLLILKSNTIYCTMIDVITYGAVGDGVTDDTQAFSKAWIAACESTSSSTVLNVPNGKKFLLNTINFQGPCKSPTLNFKVEGEIVAPSQISSWRSRNVWLTFEQVNGLIVDGNGVLDGQGANWWIKAFQSPNMRPVALAFIRCNELKLSGLTHMNSPRNHISIEACVNASITNLHIIAPQDSPNTDGIDVASSSHIEIRDSFIGTGDDCIAISSGCNNINISGIICGPGHGISIGSLGKGGDHAEVEKINVQHCVFNGTLNGARIKTWQGGSGFARNIVFQNITLVNTNNPIIIDQSYFGYPDLDSAVEVSDVSFSGFRGTSTSVAAINLSCSESVGCTRLLLENISITSSIKGKIIQSSCINAHGRSIDSTPRVECLLP